VLSHLGKGGAEVRCERPTSSGKSRWMISVARKHSSTWLMEYESGNKFGEDERVRKELGLSECLRQQDNSKEVVSSE